MVGNQQFMTINETFFSNFLLGDFNYFPGVYSKRYAKIKELSDHVLEAKKDFLELTANSSDLFQLKVQFASTTPTAQAKGLG